MPKDTKEPTSSKSKVTEKRSASPGNPFVLLMDLVAQLPRWLRIPVSIGILSILAYWAIVPEQYKAQVFSYIFNKPIGTSLFPSVEYETANYKIESNSSGGATWLLSFAFRRLRNEATKLADVIATSGSAPDFRSDTHALESLRDTYNPPKQPNLSRYVVTLDISKEPLDTPRPANIRYVTPGGFSGATSEWAGILTLQATRKASVNIRFDRNKIGRNFKFSTYQWSTPENKQLLENQNYQFDDHENGVTWEVQNPRLNHVYRIDWDW
jgi:hypothetical protein